MEEAAAGSLVFPGSCQVQTPSTVQQQAVAQCGSQQTWTDIETSQHEKKL